MKVIVGVTTTKARLGFFFYALQSLQRQNFESFKIVVSLSRDPYLFDEGVDPVPDWMAGENIQVDFVKNTGPYRKLLPQIAGIGDDDLLVTADDDILYSESWLRRLVDRALEYPDLLVCCRARVMRKNRFGGYQNYSRWELCGEREKDVHLLPTCGAGTVFRKRLLDLDFLCDEAFMTHAPTADDIWYRVASLRKKTVVFVDPDIDRANGYIEDFKGLGRVNLYQSNPALSFPSRFVLRMGNKCKDYLGIPLAVNDTAWRRSLQYSRSTEMPGDQGESGR